jgi:hypothetical protein
MKNEWVVGIPLRQNCLNCKFGSIVDFYRYKCYRLNFFLSNQATYQINKCSNFIQRKVHDLGSRNSKTDLC